MMWLAMVICGRPGTVEGCGILYFFFQAEDGIRDYKVTGVQTCALPIFDLSITVPNTNWRFGRIGKMALLGNALPVLAIHDGEGWHLPPYTSNGESFYSDRKSVV